jgi:hypothetical protein
MKHLGGIAIAWFMLSGYPGLHRFGYQPRTMWLLSPGSTLVDGHSGLKRLICLPCFRVLPVQPYDTMGSVSIEYDVRVQPRVLT